MFCLVGRETREFFEFLALLELHLFEFLVFHGEHLLLVVDARLLVVEVVLASSQFLLALVERELALLESVLALLDVLVSHLHFLFEFALLVEEFFLYFEKFFLLDHFRFFFHGGHHFVVLTFQHVLEEKISTHST